MKQTRKERLELLELAKKYTNETNISNLIVAAKKINDFLGIDSDATPAINESFDYKNNIVKASNIIDNSNSILKDDDYTKQLLSNPTDFMECLQIHTPVGTKDLFLKPYQKNLINELENNKRVLINTARQVGNSTILGIYALWKCILKKDTTVVIICPKFGQVDHHLTDILFTLEMYNSTLIKEYKKNCITLNNGSKIIGTKAVDSALSGIEPDLVIMMDISFISFSIEESFWRGMMPYFASGKQLIICSTPNCDKGLFYTLWTKGFPFKKIEINYKDAGRSEEEIMQIAENMNLSTEEFENQFNCKFKKCR